MNSAFIGSEEKFIHRLINGEEDPRLLANRYGLLAGSLLSIISDAASLNPTQASVLSGLIRNRQLEGLDSKKIDCNIFGNTSVCGDELVKLGISCGRRLFHDINIQTSDADCFRANGVVLHRSPVSYEDTRDASSGNIVKSWTLIDGGSVVPSDIFSEMMAPALSIIVYDRYFSAISCRVMADIFAAMELKTGEKLKTKVSIYIGQASSGISCGSAFNALSAFFKVPSNLKIEKSKRHGSHKFVHDRYIQVGESYTYLLTAGLAAFKDGAGDLNRASKIALSDLFISYDETKFETETGSVVIIKY